MAVYPEEEPARGEYPLVRPVARRPSALRGLFLTAVVATLVSGVVSVLVTLVLLYVLVPGGVGWNKLEHEGTVTVHGVNNPLKVHYPSSFSQKPSLSIEPQGNGSWFWRLDEQTPSYFVITNTTVNVGTGQPVHLTVRWKASGARW